MTTRPFSKSVTRVATLTGLSLCAACVGRPGVLGGIDDDDAASVTAGDGATSGASQGGESSGEDGGDDTPDVACTVSIGQSPGRALDPTRWHNTVLDLLAVDAQLGTFPFGFLRGPGYPVVVPTPALEEVYLAGAATVAEMVDLELLPLVYFMPSCEGQPEGSQADACITELATGLGRYLFRRGLEPAEVDALVSLQANAPIESRMRACIEALLSSPSFWTLDESGTPDPERPGVLVLNDHAIAARMASFIWNTAPDAQLLDRADAGELSDPAVRVAESERMLADPRAARAIADYWEWALDIASLESHTRSDSAWDEPLATSMREEVRRYVADVILAEGDWHTLMTATHSFQNAALASVVYSGDLVGAPPSGAEHELVQLDAERRPGLLTRAAVMTRWSQPGEIAFTRRGLLVIERLLCHTFPAPPPDIDSSDLLEYETLTRREALDHLLEEPSCGGCHKLATPITPGFDHYDPIGRWQETLTAVGAPAGSGAATYPVDSSGSVTFPSTGVEPFADRDELLQKLTTNEDVHACLVRGQLGFALGRELDQADACTLEHLGAAFEASGTNLRELVLEVVASEAFVRTRP
jgi:hypothetical protein